MTLVSNDTARGAPFLLEIALPTRVPLWFLSEPSSAILALVAVLVLPCTTAFLGLGHAKPHASLAGGAP